MGRLWRKRLSRRCYIFPALSVFSFMLKPAMAVVPTISSSPACARIQEFWDFPGSGSWGLGLEFFYILFLRTEFACCHWQWGLLCFGDQEAEAWICSLSPILAKCISSFCRAEPFLFGFRFSWLAVFEFRAFSCHAFFFDLGFV